MVYFSLNLYINANTCMITYNWGKVGRVGVGETNGDFVLMKFVNSSALKESESSIRTPPPLHTLKQKYKKSLQSPLPAVKASSV